MGGEPMRDFTTAELKALPKETILLAQEIKQIAGIIATNRTGGNGNIIVKLRVAGGKIINLLTFEGKLIPGGKRARDQ